MCRHITYARRDRVASVKLSKPTKGNCCLSPFDSSAARRPGAYSCTLAFAHRLLHDISMSPRVLFPRCLSLVLFLLVLFFVLVNTALADSPPALSGIPDQRTFHSMPTRPVPFTVVSPSAFTLSADSTNTGLVPTTNIIFAGSGSNWTVTVIPTTNLLGTSTISVTASNQFGAATNSFLLTVADFSDVTSTNLSYAAFGSVNWVDYDNDGYLDLFICGYDVNFNPSTHLYHNNQDGTFTEVATPFPPVAESSSDWADFDGDGYADLLLNGLVYRNLGGTNFVLVANLGPGLSGGGSVVWCDFDNDGKPDALLGSGYGTQVYHNNGDGTFNLVAILPACTGAATADYDNDGWNDILTLDSGISSVGARLYHNTGTNAFIAAVSLGNIYGMGAWGDYNNDGWPDLLLSGHDDSDDGTNLLFANNFGTLTNVPTFSNQLRDGFAAWGDFDNDGNLDFFSFGLVVGCCTQSKIYHNTGTNSFTDFGFSMPGDYQGAAAWGDYDNDGALDLVFAGRGGTKLYHNDGAMPDHPPTAPTGLSITIGFNSAILSWNASTDPDQSGGLTYNVQMGTSNGLVDVVSPLSDLVTGFRRVPKIGNAGYRTGFIITNLPGGTYYCSVQSIDNAFKGSLFSSTVGFTLPAPIITNQPQTQTVNSGMPVTFVVGANGADPKSYQWSFNGVALAGATNQLLSINSAGLSDQGAYSVVVINQYGSAVSSNANLTVLTPPSLTEQPLSQTNGMGGYTFFSGMAIGSLPISYQWYFNGSPLEGEDDWGATSNNLSIIRTIPDYAGEYFLVASNAYGSVTSSVVSLTVEVPSAVLNVDFGNGTQSLKTGPAAVGQTATDFWNFYDATNTGLTNLTLAQQLPTVTQVIMTGPRGVWTNSNPDPMFGTYLYQNALPGTLQVIILGLPKGNFDLLFYGELPQSTSFQLFVDGVSQGALGYGSADFVGTIDENSTNWVEGVHFVAFRNVAINTNSNVRVVVGGNVVDGGSAAIAGMQICPALAQPQVPLYWIQPKGGVYAPGSTVVLGATVTGQSPIQYQWYRDGVSLTDDAQVTGSSSNVLTITSSSTNYTGNYWLVATNPAGSNTSFVTRVFVGLPPTVSAQPLSQTNLVGSNVTFTVSITGTPPFSYRWRKNGANLSDGSRISGSLTATLTLTNLQTTDAAQYSVMVTNEAGTIVSGGANLTVWVPPSITQQPLSKTVLGGSNVTVIFIGNATGTIPLSYQWFKNESPISAAVNRILSLTNVRRSDSGGYAFVVTNVAGAVTSATANLIVHVPQKLTFTVTNGSRLFSSSDMDGQPLVDPDLSNFFLQTSSNLVQWTTITDGLSYTNGELQILPPAPSPNLQFYRVFESW